MRPAFHAAAAHFWRRSVAAVEVGVEFGYNAAITMAEWPHGALHMTLVEIDAAREERIREHLLSRVGWQEFDLVIGDSATVAATFPDESFDMVYIDDDHETEGVHKSVEAWRPKVRPGGILAGHDIDMIPVRAEVMNLATKTGWPLYISENDWWMLVG